MSEILLKNEETKRRFDLRVSREFNSYSYIFNWKGKRYYMALEYLYSEGEGDGAIGEIVNPEDLQLEGMKLSVASEPYHCFRRNYDTAWNLLCAIDKQHANIIVECIFTILLELHRAACGAGMPANMNVERESCLPW